jgi:hypothetical protein
VKNITIAITRGSNKTTIVVNGKTVTFRSYKLLKAVGVWIEILQVILSVAYTQNLAERALFEGDGGLFPRSKSSPNTVNGLIRKKLPELYRAIEGSFQDLQLAFDLSKGQTAYQLEKTRKGLEKVKSTKSKGFGGTDERS